MVYVCCPYVYIDKLKQPMTDLPIRYAVCLLSIRLYRQIKTTIDRSTYLDIFYTPKYRTNRHLSSISQ